MTGAQLGQLLEAAASGAERVDLDGEEINFAEALRSIAESAYEQGRRAVDVEITLIPSSQRAKRGRS